MERILLNNDSISAFHIRHQKHRSIIIMFHFTHKLGNKQNSLYLCALIGGCDNISNKAKVFFFVANTFLCSKYFPLGD